jgi:hypothetical protein
MPDSMTFRARQDQGECKFCGTSDAMLDLEIRCAPEGSLEQGACCFICADNLLAALARVKPQP